MEILNDGQATQVDVPAIINEIDSLIKRKEEATSDVDLEEYQKNLQKIEAITNDHNNASILNSLP